MKYGGSYGQLLSLEGELLWDAGGIPLVSLPGAQQRPSLSPDRQGGALLAYLDRGQGDGYADIRLQRLSPTGTVLWAASGVSVTNAPDHQGLDAMVADGTGGAILFWKDFRSHTNYDLYAQWISSDGVPQWAANGVLVAQCAYDQLEAAAVPTRAGVLAVWSDARNGEALRIYGQLIAADGTLIPPLPAILPGVPWHAFNHPVCPASPPSSLYSFQGVPDRQGGAVLFWVRQETDGLSSLHAQRVSAEAEGLWGPSGIQLLDQSVQLNSTCRPWLFPDGASGAIVAWKEGPPLSGKVYVQRVSANGTLVWAPRGVPVEADLSGGTPVGAVPDGAGGTIIFLYYGAPTGTQAAGLYAQRVDSSGAPAWPSGGIFLTSDRTSPSGLDASPDGAGGALVTWVRSSDQPGNTRSLLMARRIDTNGSLLWDSEVTVADHAGYISSPRIVPSGAGMFILSWKESQPAGDRLAAQKLDSSGAV